jgi:hypothetical protein
MKEIRQMLHRKIAEALGCETEADYQRRRQALLQYFKQVNPDFFKLEGGRKRSFERMAAMEGVTVEEKLEDFALTGYLLQRSLEMTGPRASKEEALAELATLGLGEEDMAVLRRAIETIDGCSKRSE